MRPGKILVVDDDPEVRMATRDFLSSKGYDVSVAEGGRDALRQLDSSPADVVLLDVAMPDMDGLETLKRIVSAHPNVPVIISEATWLEVKDLFETRFLGEVTVKGKEIPVKIYTVVAGG